MWKIWSGRQWGIGLGKQGPFHSLVNFAWLTVEFDRSDRVGVLHARTTTLAVFLLLLSPTDEIFEVIIV